MNWWLVTGGFVLAWIGGTLINDGENAFAKWLGLSVVIFAGFLLCFGLEIPQWQGYIKPDNAHCAQYVQVQDTWKCVPWEEGG